MTGFLNFYYPFKENLNVKLPRPCWELKIAIQNYNDNRRMRSIVALLKARLHIRHGHFQTTKEIYNWMQCDTRSQNAVFRKEMKKGCWRTLNFFYIFKNPFFSYKTVVCDVIHGIFTAIQINLLLQNTKLEYFFQNLIDLSKWFSLVLFGHICWRRY